MKSKNLLITALSLSAVMAATQSQAQNPNMDDITMTLREHNRGEIAQQLDLPTRESLREHMLERGDLTPEQLAEGKALREEVKAMLEAGERGGLMADRAEQMTAFREQFQNMVNREEVQGVLAQMREQLEEHLQQAGSREDLMGKREELLGTLTEHREQLLEAIVSKDELREMLTEKRGELGELGGEQRQILDELRESLGQREASTELAADMRTRVEQFKSKLQQQRNGN